MYICKSLRGLHGLLKSTRTLEDKTTLIELSDSLMLNTRATLQKEDTHDLPGAKNKLFQISVHDMRIIYFEYGNDIFVVNFFYKQKNKTGHHLSTADKRATKWKQILNII